MESKYIFAKFSDFKKAPKSYVFFTVQYAKGLLCKVFFSSRGVSKNLFLLPFSSSSMDRRTKQLRGSAASTALPPPAAAVSCG